MSGVSRAGVSVAAWLALTLGIALNTTTFSTLEGFLMRPLPIHELDSVVRVREVARGNGAEQVFSMSPLSFVSWREHNQVFDDMAAATGQALTLTGAAEPLRVAGASVSANFFDLLGVRAALGRTFAEGEDRSGENNVAVLSHRLWQRHFGGDPGLLGRTAILDGRPHTIVGIMPRGFSHPYDAELWTPFDIDALLRGPSGNYLYVPARLRSGLDIAAAQDELDRMAGILHVELPQLGATNASRLTPLRDEVLGTLRPVLLVLFGGSLLVLLLAVINVGNLLLTRSFSERHDTAVRIALGAGRSHLFRRALLRSGTVAAGAWLAGLGVCLLSMEPMLGLAGASSINEFDVAPRVNAVTAGYALAVALAVALALALLDGRASRVDGPVQIGREKCGSMPVRLRRTLVGLVAAQFALSFALAGATVLVATGYSDLVDGDLGYEPAGLLAADLAFSLDRYPDPASRAAFVNRTLEALRAAPGVLAAGASTVTPDAPGSWGAGFVVPGYEPPAVPGYELTHHRVASAGYLAALGAPLLAGRDFDHVNPSRDAGSVVISRHFAEQYWGTPHDALGRTMTRVTRAGTVDLTVVGVVGDVAEAEQSSSFDVPRAWYLPLAMGTDYDFSGVTLVVRGGSEAAASLRQVIQRMDPNLALHRLSPMSERLAGTYSRERWSRFMFGLFGLTACVIAVVGLYSAMNFITTLRRREFGIRMALGAQPASIAGGIVFQALAVGIVGVAVGLPLLMGMIALLQSYFAGMGPGDAAGVAWVAIVLCAVAAAAALPPALRAAHVAPMQALAEE